MMETTVWKRVTVRTSDNVQVRKKLHTLTVLSKQRKNAIREKGKRVLMVNILYLMSEARPRIAARIRLAVKLLHQIQL